MPDATFVATATLDVPNVVGAFREIWGTYKSGTNATAYTGDVTTGLKEIHVFQMTRTATQSTAISGTAEAWVVTSLPAVGNITIVSGTSQLGQWYAKGV